MIKKYYIIGYYAVCGSEKGKRYFVNTHDAPGDWHGTTDIEDALKFDSLIRADADTMILNMLDGRWNFHLCDPGGNPIVKDESNIFTEDWNE